MITIKDNNSSQYEIKKSKFLSFAFYVEDCGQCDKILNEIKIKYKDSTHICYAYKLVNSIEKCCDDGEPSGTAGLTILSILKKINLINVIIIVVRYFGGIKLGVGGLSRAYKTSAKSVLDKCEYVQLYKCNIIRVKVTLSKLKSFENKININNNLKVLSKTFLGDEAIFEIAIEELQKINLEYDYELLGEKLIKYE